MTHLTIRQPEEKSLSQKQPAKTHTTLKMTAQDDRGFQKTDLVMWNPQAPNFQSDVNLVERDTCPNGYQLLDPDRSVSEAKSSSSFICDFPPLDPERRPSTSWWS